MVLSVKILSLKKNYLNVKIPENGLFGYIRINSSRQEDFEKQYEVGTFIKAIIVGFPFDSRENRNQNQQEEEQELLKVEMALEFPHETEDSRHDCHNQCFANIVKKIHPSIDLEKDRFVLRKDDKPVLEIKEEKNSSKAVRTEFRRIMHPKFKNISSGPAI